MGIIDCDVHNAVASVDEIRSYMKEPWRSRYTGIQQRIYSNNVHTVRADAYPPSGNHPGSDPDFMRKQLIEKYGIDHAILLPLPFCSMLPDPDFASAIASAYNDWMADTWLSKYNPDGVFKGSIIIAPQDPLAAAKEIERWAGHPHFVQVMVDSGSRAMYGQRQYNPIYEVCNRYGLPFAIHPGSDGNGINDQPTPGYPTHAIEWHADMPLSYWAHLASFITEGVFERYPNLKVVCVECGISWLPALMWRLDAEYKSLRSEVPWVKRLPSEYFKDHIRVTSQPLEQPKNKQHILTMLDMMDAEHILLFSSDYPHFDFDAPDRTFPKLPERLANRIFYENARELYRL